jgi:hypothetical protein
MTSQISTGSPTIPIVQTSPDEITLHRIEEHELEAFMNIARPYSLAFATTAAGGFLGLLPGVLASLGHAGTGLKTTELVEIGAAVFCLAIAIVTGIYAGQGLLDADRAIKRIKARPKVPC